MICWCFSLSELTRSTAGGVNEHTEHHIIRRSLGFPAHNLSSKCAGFLETLIVLRANELPLLATHMVTEATMVAKLLYEAMLGPSPATGLASKSSYHISVDPDTCRRTLGDLRWEMLRTACFYQSYPTRCFLWSYGLRPKPHDIQQDHAKDDRHFKSRILYRSLLGPTWWFVLCWYNHRDNTTWYQLNLSR